jgi:hypothetical protein
MLDEYQIAWYEALLNDAENLLRQDEEANIEGSAVNVWLKQLDVIKEYYYKYEV